MRIPAERRQIRGSLGEATGPDAEEQQFAAGGRILQKKSEEEKSEERKGEKGDEERSVGAPEGDELTKAVPVVLCGLKGYQERGGSVPWIFFSFCPRAGWAGSALPHGPNVPNDGGQSWAIQPPAGRPP